MSWSSLRIQPSNDTASRDAVVAALFANGVQAIVEDGSAIVTHIHTGDLETICSAIKHADHAAGITDAVIEEQDWTVAWRANVKSHRVGNLTVAPPWLSQDLDPRSTIVIDPGMAFGTGDHESTRGVLRMLPAMLPPGTSVADLGAGSAVLSIAAAKLGATKVYAIELDPDAIGNAEENVRVNNVADRVHVLEGDAATLLALVAPVDVVLANIISSVLHDLLPVIEDSLAPGGRAILSGLLESEREAFSAGLKAGGWRKLIECVEGDWWTVAIART